MHKRIRLIGLPGTGKTTRLLQMLDELMQIYDSTDIIYASFSNAAVNEAKERVHDKFGITEDRLPYFRTLHSLCLRVLRDNDFKLGSEPAKPTDFEIFLQSNITPTVQELIDDITAYISLQAYIPDEDKDSDISTYTLYAKPGRHFLAIFAMLNDRYGCTPLDSRKFSKYVHEFLDTVGIPKRYRRAYISTLIELETGWQEYKRSKDLFEFAELLSRVYKNRLVPDASILIVDEFQDSSSLQSKLVNYWSEHMEQTVVAGDPNQAIYGFNGASPEYLENFDYDETILLNKSWRVPAPIIEYAKEILDNTWTEQMVAADDKPGRVWTTDLAGIDFNEYESIYILARTGSILKVIKKEMQKMGMIKGSSDQVVRNLYRVYYAFTRREDLDFSTLLRLYESGRSMPGKSIFPDTMTQIFRDGTGRRGSMSNRSVTPQMLQQIIGFRSIQELEDKIIHRCNSKQKTQLMEMIKSNAQPVSDDFDDSRIKLMTLHASKGMEAELVVLVNGSSWYERKNRIDEDEERRLFFVGATRTMRDLVILDHHKIEETKFLPDTDEVQISAVSKTTGGKVGKLFG